MPKTKLKKISSLSELRRLASADEETDGPYCRLAKVAASNLGQPCESLRAALQSLENLCWETSEKGTVNEINYVRDLVK